MCSSDLQPRPASRRPDRIPRGPPPRPEPQARAGRLLEERRGDRVRSEEPPGGKVTGVQTCALPIFSPGLQAADLIAYLAAHRHDPSHRPELADYWRSVEEIALDRKSPREGK